MSVFGTKLGHKIKVKVFEVLIKAIKRFYLKGVSRHLNVVLFNLFSWATSQLEYAVKYAVCLFFVAHQSSCHDSVMMTHQ